MVDSFWQRVRQSQGPRLDFGSFLYDDWGDVPGRSEAGQLYSPGNPTGAKPGDATWPGSVLYTGNGNTNTTSVPAGSGVGVGALGPLVTGQARTGTGQSGQGQVGGAGVVGTFNGATTAGGSLPFKMPGGWNPAGNKYSYNFGPPPPTGDPGSYLYNIGYKSGQDTHLHRYSTNPDGSGGHTQNNFHRVYGWMNAIAKANGYGDIAEVPREWLPQIASYAIGRLKTDYEKAGADWNQSGFAVADRSLAGAAGNTAQGGNTVVSPLNSQGQPGMASGAPPTAPGAQMGQPGGQGSTDYNLYLQNNKVGRMAELLTRLGLGTPQRQRSFVGSTLANTYTDLFDPWMQTQGIGGGNVADNFSNLMDNFVGKMQGSGGMGAIANDANAAIRAIAQGGSPYAQGLGDTELFGLLKGFNQLANTPMNPWMQQAYGNLSDDALFNFAQQQGQRLKTGGVDQGTAQTLLQFLQSDPRYGFLTGQGR